MATEYPRSKFTGIDVAPSYPIHIKPHNVEFLQANILNGLPYADNTFDFVFMIFAFLLKNAIKEISEMSKMRTQASAVA